MVYTSTTAAPEDSTRSESCPECHSKRLLFSRGVLTCTNCGFVIGARKNKYGAKKAMANDGTRRDSMFERDVANELLLRKRSGDIKDYDSQFHVVAIAYTADGKVAFTEKHKVDFRIHHNDGSFELYEAKGIETDNYKFKKKCLLTLWLPLHKDHIYTVVKQRQGWR